MQHLYARAIEAGDKILVNGDWVQVEAVSRCGDTIDLHPVTTAKPRELFAVKPKQPTTTAVAATAIAAGDKIRLRRATVTVTATHKSGDRVAVYTCAGTHHIRAAEFVDKLEP